MHTMNGRPVHVLLVDDDEVDAEAVVRAFRKLNIANPITIVSNGHEALNALRGEGGYAPIPSPYLVLLDINMPRMNGLEFLQVLRQDPDLKRSIVFILTTSSNDEDILAAYEAHVAGYILKTRAGEQFLELPQMMQRYWRVVEFPN
ncbi:MAG TPA: response regulator [Caldilineaceae bacterium]|nr:response regulator [Caldilineaceae bacterium]